MERINPAGLARPSGFSHAVSVTATRTVYLAGQTGTGPDGKVVGGGIAPQVYGGPAYYGPADVPSSDYYDDSTAASPPPGDNDAVGHCMQTHRSYDPESGTYLGDDGQRLPCP